MRVKAAVFASILLSTALCADLEYTITNTNFTLSQGSIDPRVDQRYLYNYDRLRLRSDYTYENYFMTFIGDGVNYFGHEYINTFDFEYIRQLESDTPFKTETTYSDYYEGTLYAKLYRFYGGYEDENNRIALGLQNITIGVGRLWNPTNLFNPRNTYALEPDETFGVAALAYTRHLSETADLRVVVSQKKDHTFKYAGSLKAFLEFGDVGLNVVKSDETLMVGYELEGNLAETGIEVRSEGAYIKNSALKTFYAEKTEEFFQGLLGGDYGFENGVTLIVEGLYSSKKFHYQDVLLNLKSEISPNLTMSQFYLGSSITYDFNIFLNGALTYIESFNDKNSRFISPTLTYTFNDFNTFVLGAMIQNGPKKSEFGQFENTYYFKYQLAF